MKRSNEVNQPKIFLYPPGEKLTKRLFFIILFFYPFKEIFFERLKKVAIFTNFSRLFEA